VPESEIAAADRPYTLADAKDHIYKLEAWIERLFAHTGIEKPDLGPFPEQPPAPGKIVDVAGVPHQVGDPTESVYSHTISTAAFNDPNRVALTDAPSPPDAPAAWSPPPGPSQSVHAESSAVAPGAP
jgi:hypothetical protein